MVVGRRVSLGRPVAEWFVTDNHPAIGMDLYAMPEA